MSGQDFRDFGVTMFATPTPTNDPGASHELHRAAFVFDYVPTGEPLLMTERLRRVMNDSLRRQAPVGNTLRAMYFERLHELEESEEVRRALREIWDASGVNAIQLTLGGLELIVDAWEAVVRDIAYWRRRMRAGGDMRLVETPKEMHAARKDGLLGVMFGMQDAAPIERDLGRLEILRNFGVRVIQLTYNFRNAIGDGCTERNPAGLSRFGNDAVRRMNELGIVVDVSHCGPQTTFDAIKNSSRPVAITHATCLSVANHARAKSDDHLRALKDADGYMGVAVVPFFLKPEGGADLETFLRHFEHAVNILGPERVGVATDWGGWTPDMPVELADASRASFIRLGMRESDLPQWRVSIPEFDEWSKWPNLTVGLLAAGWSESEARGFIGENWLRFLDRAIA